MQSDYDKPIELLKGDAKLGRFREWFKLSAEAWAEFRKLAERAIAFQIPANQWPEGTNRQGRPTIEVDLLRHPKQIVQNQASQANVGVDLHPVSPDASDELAEVKSGLYSRSQRDGGAKIARLWGLDYAKQAGLGWYRITTQYDEDSDDPTDQEIVYERIFFQDMVYPDPAAQKPDFSDGRFLFQAAYVPVESLGMDYEGVENTTAEGFKDLISSEPDWVRVEGEKCSVLLVECFYKVWRTQDGKRRNRPVVWRAVLTGKEIIEDKPYLAPTDKPEEGRRYIPVVPVIGTELQPVKGKRMYEGMTGPAMGSQIAHNFFASTLVETVASEPKNPIMAPDESIGPYKKLWDALATDNPAYLPFKAMSDGEGRPLQPPFRMPSDQGRMSIALMALGQSKDWVESTTAFNPPSLGEAPQRRDAQSGRAIKALQGATEAGTSQYMDNLETISLPLDARIWLDMAPVIYDRPGRAAEVLGAENKTRSVILNAPYAEVDGRPVPVDMIPPEKRRGADIKHYDLSKGRYSVVPTVGRPPQTRLEKGQEFLTQVIAAAPDLMPIIGDLVFEYRDEPGAKQIAERLRKNLPPNLLDDGKGSAEAAKAQLANLQMQVQQMGEQLKQASQYIQTDQAKHESAERMKAAEFQNKVQIQQMQDATTIAVAQINAEIKGLQLATEAQNEERATGLKIAHEIREQEKDRFHEVQARHEEMAHDKAMAAAGANTVTRTMEGGQDQQHEQSQEQGHETLPPEPQADGAGE